DARRSRRAAARALSRARAGVELQSARPFRSGDFQMKIEISEALTIEGGQVSFAQLIEYSGLNEQELRDLIDYGALSPRDPSAKQWSFDASALPAARLAQRLRHDFELDANALSVVLSFAARVEELEEELRALRAGVAR